MLLFGFVQTNDGFGDLINQIAFEVSRLQIQIPRQLSQQIQSRAGRPVQVDDLVQVGIQAGQPDSGGGGFARAGLAGEKTGAAVIGEKLQARLQLGPGGGFKQLFGIGRGGKGSFLKAKEGFKHRRPPVFGEAVRRS